MIGQLVSFVSSLNSTAITDDLDLVSLKKKDVFCTTCEIKKCTGTENRSDFCGQTISEMCLESGFSSPFMKTVPLF